MLTLAFDTSGKALSLALLEDEAPCAEFMVVAGTQHTETLLPVMQQLLDLTGRRIGQVDLLSCTHGPGSFTGLRIGLSTAKGLALALDRPIVGVSTLEALACNLSSGDLTCCPMLDARKNQVYCALYKTSPEGLPEVIMGEDVVDVSDILAEITDETIFLGDGAVKYRDLISKALPGKARFTAPRHNLIQASSVGILGLRRFRQGAAGDVASLRPVYVRGLD